MPTTTSATVYISNMNKEHNYASATLFGAIKPVTSGNYPVFKTARLLEEIVGSLLHSRPEDFLLISGSSVIAALTLQVWITMHRTCQLLIYDRAERGYVVRQLSTEQIGAQIEQAIDASEQSTREEPNAESV